MALNESILGVNLNPSVGEFVYDTIPYRAGNSVINCFSDFSMHNTDLCVSINKLKSEYPNCKTININVSWFCSSLDANTAIVYPSTIYQNILLESFNGSNWENDYWNCSGLNNFSNLNPITSPGTPSDQSILRLISYLKNQGFKIAFTPKLIVDGASASTITYSPDLNTQSTTAVHNFVGQATPSMFSFSGNNLNYTGEDFSYSRMILHYATLCSKSGVDLFLIGTDLMGLEAIRGASWTVQGQSDGNGAVTWDYPFVASLNALADQVKSILPKSSVVYGANWQTWMGITHQDKKAKIPHLDQLYSNPNIDFIAINNFQPLSDWLPNGIDETYWSAQPSATSLAFPSSPNVMNNLALSGTPSIYDENYLSENIEGGENYSWYYLDNSPGIIENNIVSPTESSDRKNQNRKSYKNGQDLLATKRYDWWLSNFHKPVFDANNGMGMVAHGIASQWKPSLKSIIFTDYGFNQIDKCTNQPSSLHPYWANISNGYPQKDETLYEIAFEVFYNHWKNVNYMIASNWDVRSVPRFPLNNSWSLKDYWSWFIKTLK
jgi:hypothetical protein